MTTTQTVALPPAGRGAKLARAESILRLAEQKAGIAPAGRWEPAGELPGAGVGALGVPLSRGSIIGVTGSTSLLLALLSAAAGEDSWVAVIGKPALGLAALKQFGLSLERMVLVPAPGSHAAGALAALIDGFDVVVVGDAVGLGAGQRRSLLGRARRWRTTLFTPAWPEAPLRLAARPGAWEGAGRGGGYVRTQRIAVRQAGRAGEWLVTIAPGSAPVVERAGGLRRVG